MSEPATHKYKVILYFEWKDATVCRIIEDNEWSIRNVCKCFQIKKKKLWPSTYFILCFGREHSAWKNKIIFDITLEY